MIIASNPSCLFNVRVLVDNIHYFKNLVLFCTKNTHSVFFVQNRTKFLKILFRTLEITSLISKIIILFIIEARLHDCDVFLITQYREDGFVVIENFLDDQEIKSLLSECRELVTNMNPSEHKTVFSAVNQQV